VTEQTANRLGKRLGRILVMLPYAIRHPGVSVDELARKVGVRKQELLNDLELVFMCGLPGYGPGDLIDVVIDEDQIFVRMADYFSAPLRLSPAEALGLYASGSAVASIPGLEPADALHRALEKLKKALGGGDLAVAMEGGPEEHLNALQDALDRQKAVRIEYHSAAQGELSERNVEPWGLIAALGRWYLVGLDHKSAEERMFRVDRIKSVEVTDAPAPVPEDFDPQLYRKAWRSRSDEPTITIEISPGAARWFEDYYPVEKAEDLPDGWRRLTLATSGNHWAATLLLRLGDQVRNVEPPEVVEATKGLAGEIAARY
jgi:proteasome accessory factor C